MDHQRYLKRFLIDVLIFLIMGLIVLGLSASGYDRIGAVIIGIAAVYFLISGIYRWLGREDHNK
jgi:hypothetical protein